MITWNAQVYLSFLKETNAVIRGNPLTRRMPCEGESILS